MVISDPAESFVTQLLKMSPNKGGVKNQLSGNLTKINRDVPEKKVGKW